MRRPLAPPAKPGPDPSPAPESDAKSDQPPARSTEISPRPSQLTSTDGAATTLGTFSSSTQSTR